MNLLANSPRLVGFLEDTRSWVDVTGNAFVVLATIGVATALWSLARQA